MLYLWRVKKNYPPADGLNFFFIAHHQTNTYFFMVPSRGQHKLFFLIPFPTKPIREEVKYFYNNNSQMPRWIGNKLTMWVCLDQRTVIGYVIYFLTRPNHPTLGREGGDSFSLHTHKPANIFFFMFTSWRLTCVLIRLCVDIRACRY